MVRSSACRTARGGAIGRGTTRLVVCARPTPPLCALVDGLEARGWTPVWAADASEVTRCLNDTPAPVGLCSFDGDTGDDPARLEPFVLRDDCEWIFLQQGAGTDCAQTRQLVARGAYAVHRLPGDIDGLDTLLRHAADMRERRLAERDPTAPARSDEEHQMVGTTESMQRLFHSIRKVAGVDAPILIRGESGTGKELAARGVHERSGRSDGPFVAVNCAALPSELVQSELFGHEKGAFTGAVQRHVGRIEAAAGGTILLDEIGDLPLSLQVQLLRFLQNGTIQRVGGGEEISIDVRILAATHVCLEDAVARGEFRDDLYHRLNVLQLGIPPLRERPEDIEVLARFFFERFSAERAPHVRGISEQAIRVMRRHDWPGNVRELINRMRRAMVMSEGRLIRPADLDLEERGSTREPVSLQQAREQAEIEAIRSALARNGHCVAHAAEELGVSRVTLYRLVDKHGLALQQAS